MNHQQLLKHIIRMFPNWYVGIYFLWVRSLWLSALQLLLLTIIMVLRPVGRPWTGKVQGEGSWLTGGRGGGGASRLQSKTVDGGEWGGEPPTVQKC